MTRLFSSSLALPLAFAVTLTAAGCIAAFTAKADAAGAHATTSIRCFLGANADAKRGMTGGWVCVPEQRNADTHTS